MASLMTVVHRAAASSVSAASRSVGAPCFLIAKLCNLSSGVCSTSYLISITAPTGCESCEKQRIGESFHWDEISLGKQSSRRFSGFARRNVLNEFTSRERLFFPQLLELFSGRWSGCPKRMIPSHWENNSRKWARDDIYFLRKIYLRKFENLCIYIYM